MDVDRIPDRFGHELLQIVPQHPDDGRLNAGVLKYYIFVLGFIGCKHFSNVVGPGRISRGGYRVFQGAGTIEE